MKTNYLRRMGVAASLLVVLGMVATVPVMQTGCKLINGTNTFDVDAAADGIRNYLGPLVVWAENADPQTIGYFQTASAGIGAMILNHTTDVGTLQAKLDVLVKNPLAKLAIDEAIAAYSQYLGQAVAAGVDQSEAATKLLQAFKDALDKGVKASARRLQAHRPAIRVGP